MVLSLTEPFSGSREEMDLVDFEAMVERVAKRVRIKNFPGFRFLVDCHGREI